jgi:hypothetical protein
MEQKSCSLSQNVRMNSRKINTLRTKIRLNEEKKLSYFSGYNCNKRSRIRNLLFKIVGMSSTGIFFNLGGTTHPVFRIRDILRRICILGSVHWIASPDYALFVSGFTDANK